MNTLTYYITRTYFIWDIQRQQKYDTSGIPTMTFGQWNVRTLLDREGTAGQREGIALVAMELRSTKLTLLL